jgi:hypothetical protein
MTVKNTLTQAGFAALCAISLSTVVSSSALAVGSVTYPGELVGVAWAPLPEGVYAVNTSSFSDNRNVGGGTESSVYVDIPVIAWSTPWTFLGGRIEAYVAGPFLGAYTNGGLYTNDFYDPFVAVGESFDLGHGFYVANFVGSYIPINNALGIDYWTPNDRFAFGYTGDGWDLTSHTTFGFRMNAESTNAGGILTPMVAGFHNGDYINEDLTATKKFGKWEVGPVAYGSWDIGGCNSPVGGACTQQGQFAVGGLVGYDFGGLYGQVYLTRDVWHHNYANYETNIFGRIIIPLWNPPAAPKPLVSKY